MSDYEGEDWTHTVTALRGENQKLRDENERISQRTCDECDGEGWVYNRVEGRGACTCMIEAQPFQILFEAVETVYKASTGEIQIADDDTDGMAWIAKMAYKALHSVLPLDYPTL